MSVLSNPAASPDPGLRRLCSPDVETNRRAALELLDLMRESQDALPSGPTPTPTPTPTPAPTSTPEPSAGPRRSSLRPTPAPTSTGTIHRHYQSGVQLNDEPAIYLFDDFVDEIEGEALMAAAKTNLKRGLVTGEKTAYQSDSRTGQMAWVGHDHTAAIGRLARRISDLVGLPLTNAEAFQVVHYGENQQYAPHHDGWDPDTEKGKRCLEHGGQRLVTCLFYLNDVPEGGGTCFPALDMEVRALRGRMVLFHNCEVGSNRPAAGAKHGGLPVERGEKWAGNLWFRERNHHHGTPRSGQFSRVV